MKLSIVTSIYFSEDYIEEFYTRISASISKITEDYEIIVVCDGKTDSCDEIVQRIITNDSRVKLITLSKNYGAAAARWEGLRNSSGDYVYVTDADLEESPELLNGYFNLLTQRNDLDVVYGFLEERKGAFFEKISGLIYYKLLYFLTEIKLSNSPASSRLMKRNYVTALLQFSEYHLFALGVWFEVGFVQEGVPILKGDKGYSTYTLRKKISQSVNSIVSFSDKPLKLISYLGIMMSLGSFLLILILLLSKVFLVDFMSGWVSTIASIFFVGGVILIALGVVGIYVGKSFQQVKNRPRVVVKRTVNI